MKDLVANILATIVLVALFAIVLLVTGLVVLGAISIWAKVLSFF